MGYLMGDADNLVDYLTGSQVSVPPALSCGTETASHPAARLHRNTYRPAFVIRQKYRLVGHAVFAGEQILDGTVRRNL